MLNMDWLICIDDQQCLKGLQLLQEGTPYNRTRWHNQKYFTWVEQQGKSIEELRALTDPNFWLKEQAKIADIDKKLSKAREF